MLQQEPDQLLVGAHHIADETQIHRSGPASDDELLARMARYGVDNVMMWGEWKRMRWSEETQARLEQAGYHVWVHTPRNPEDINAFRARGVGVYSNGYIEACEDLRG